jgi:hypothetical protein
VTAGDGTGTGGATLRAPADASASTGGTDTADLPPLPAMVRARFPGHDQALLRAAPHRGFVIGRLLEEGSGEELRWLAATVGAPALAGWVQRHGARGLSRRSRAFWERVLAVEAGEPPALARELWPLA